jgi:UDP-N-acetylmuramate: L-alanyl-gamma-D-glutamyl-meso-diaminopimelate ligase
MLIDWVLGFENEDANLLLMSSGNFDGADMLTFAKQVTGI